MSIIIPVYHKWELTRNCLRSLHQHTPLEGLEILVVDNGTSQADQANDLTPQEAPALGKALFGECFHYLPQDRNINFGPACNVGADAAHGDNLLFLNNDTLVTEHWLPPLLEALALPATAGVGPLLAYQDDSVQHLGIGINPAGDKLSHIYAHLPRTHRLARKSRSFPAITAAALMIPASRFHQVGGFFSEFVNGFEDVDLCFRLAQNGQFRVVPQSLVYHLESQSAKRHNADLHNSRLLTSRWDLADFANLEALAEADGYVLRVDPCLDIHITPHPSRLPGLLKAMRNPRDPKRIDLQAAWDLLTDEPYWEEGYALLGQALEGAGMLEEAFQVGYHGLMMTPSLAGHERLLRVMRRSPSLPGREESLAELELSYQEQKKRIMDEAGHAARLEKIIPPLLAHGKQTLAAQYREAAAEAAKLRAGWQ